MKLKKTCILLAVLFLIANIILVNPVQALSELQKKAADINKDGNIDNQDIDLMVQIGFPEAPNSGTAKNSSDGNYIFRNSLLGVGVTGSDGEFTQEDNDIKIYGYYTTSFSGTLRTHVIYRQSSSFFPGQCNRAAIASIASGYVDSVSDPFAASRPAQSAGNNMGSDYYSTVNYLAEFGLSATWINSSVTSFSNVENDIITYMANGKYIMFWFPGSTKGQTHQWTYDVHWIALLDIQSTDDGGYAVFVSDSGRGGTLEDNYGLGQGWYKLEEFEGTTIQYVVAIGE